MYKPLILKGMGFDGNVALLLVPAAIQVPAAFAVLFSILKVDRIGRKPLLLAGISTMIVADALIAYTYHTGVDGIALKTLAIAGFVSFQAGFGLGFGALVWVYAAESFPGEMRAAGASMLLTADLGVSLFTAQFFLSILDAFGGMSTFLALLAAGVVAWLFCWRLAPETKGRPLDAIKGYWENGGKWPDHTGQPTAGVTPNVKA